MPSGIDQSWGFADPAAVARAGVQVVSMYLSYDQSKNVTAAKVRAYHQAGVAVLVNWESIEGAPLLGAARGRADATEAVRQLRALIAAVGYSPRNRVTIDFSCDTDVTASQIAGPVADYYRAGGEVCHAAGVGVGCYGEADVVHYLAAQQITDSEWQTLAWSGGVIDPAADFYQFQINTTLAGSPVDLDTVIDAAQLGAWWPPGHPLDTPGDSDMPLTDAEIDRIWQRGILLDDGTTTWTAAHVLKRAYTEANGARLALSNVQAAVDGVAKLVASLPTRVASIQSTVNTIGKTTTALGPAVAAIGAAVKAITPAQQIKVDAEAIADAVVARVKGLTTTLTGKLGA